MHNDVVFRLADLLEQESQRLSDELHEAVRLATEAGLADAAAWITDRLPEPRSYRHD